MPQSPRSDEEETKTGDKIKVLPTKNIKVIPHKDLEIAPTEAEGLEAEIADVPLTDDKDYTEIIKDILDEPQTFEMPEDSTGEYIQPEVPNELGTPDYSMHEDYEIEQNYDENELTEHEIYEQLKDDGYVVRTRIERDVDMIMRPLEPDPFKDKENDLKEKKGIPRYIDRAEG